MIDIIKQNIIKNVIGTTLHPRPPEERTEVLKGGVGWRKADARRPSHLS